MLFKLQVKIRQILALARFTPFDTTTEDGRSNERHRLILLSAGASALAKVVSIFTTLVSIPLTLHYLGVERFGLWMAISSLIALLSFADLGIGNGLLNSISEANGRDDAEEIQRYISSGFVILTVIAIVMLLVFYLIYPFIDWSELFNVKTPLAIEEASGAVSILIFCFALNIPAGIIQRTQMGLQLGFVASLWLVAGSLLGLIAILTVIHFKLGLPWLVGGVLGAPILVAIFNSLVFFGKLRPDIRPKFSSVCKVTIKKVSQTSFLFLALQITISLVFASDSIVISKLLGAEAVTHFAIPDKLFSVIPILLGMILIPLWPAYGEAISRGDSMWVNRIFKRSFITSFVFAVITSLILIIFGNKILNAWVGNEVYASLSLLVGMALWKIVEACGYSISMLLNGANVLKFQVICCLFLMIFALPLKVYFIKEIGVAGAVWGNSIAYIICILIPYFLVVPRLLERISENLPTRP